MFHSYALFFSALLTERWLLYFKGLLFRDELAELLSQTPQNCFQSITMCPVLLDIKLHFFVNYEFLVRLLFLTANSMISAFM